jgi:very-long-chain (3R)-3-hydroxyacyl-CoA dehydratase
MAENRILMCSYAALQAGVAVELATGLRYTAFIPLYPLGVSCELASIWLALPAMDLGSPFDTNMPNIANLVFHQAALERCVLVLQPLLWLQLYVTLLRQRSKRLALGPKPDTKQA